MMMVMMMMMLMTMFLLWWKQFNDDDYGFFQEHCWSTRLPTKTRGSTSVWRRTWRVIESLWQHPSPSQVKYITSLHLQTMLLQEFKTPISFQANQWYLINCFSFWDSSNLIVLSQSLRYWNQLTILSQTPVFDLSSRFHLTFKKIHQIASSFSQPVNCCAKKASKFRVSVIIYL